MCEKYPNLYLKLTLDYYEKIKELEDRKDLRFFFDTRVSDWDTLLGLIDFRVTDVYVVEDLCFELDKVAEIAHSRGVKIRIYPNVAQSKWYDSNPLKKFFVRPEDIDMYKDYVDSVEFYNVDKKLETYYKIYALNKKWFGKLNEIILDFNSELDNKYVIPRFIDKRISCGKKCLKGARCRRCDNVETLSKTLEKSGLVVRVDANEDLPIDKNKK